MALTPASTAEVNAQERGDALLFLVTVEHSQLVTPIRLIKNTEEFTSRSNTYTAAPFRDLGLTDQTEGRPPRGRIAMDDAGKEAMALLRSIDPRDPPKVTVELVMASEPDNVIRSFPEALIREGVGGGVAVEFELRPEEGAAPTTSFPGFVMDPQSNPGIFE